MQRLIYFEKILKNYKKKLIGFFLKLYLLSHGCQVGKGLKCKGWPIFRTVPFRNIIIGDYVTLSKGVVIELVDEGILHLDDYVFIGEYVLLSSAKKIKFGKWSGAGEFSSIRDSDHGSAKGMPIRIQSCISEPIIIGDDVQISRNCTILRGVKIPDGVVIGANSMVIKTSKLEPNCIYQGDPLNFIWERQ